MTQQIMLNKYEQKTNQAGLVENEVKSHFSTIIAMDMIDLSWVFEDDDLHEKIK